MKRGVLVAAALAACALVGGWVVATFVGRGERGAGAEEEGGEAVAPSAMAGPVTTAVVTAGDLPIESAAFGTVQAAPSAMETLTTRASGRVLETLVTPGESVQKGEVVLRLDPTPFEVAVTAAQERLAAAERALRDFETSGRDRQRATLATGLARAKAAAELARSDVERLRPLAKQQRVPPRRLEEAEQALATATAERDRFQRTLHAFDAGGADRQHGELAAARSSSAAQLEQAQRDLAAAEVDAPADGILVALQVQPGANVAAGAPLGTLLVGDERRIVFDVSPDVASRVQPGARTHWRDGAGEVREGTVTSVLPVADPISGLCHVVVVPTGGGEPPPPGRVVEGALEVGRVHDAVLVPEAAVVRAEDRSVVIVAGDDDRAHRRPVRVVARTGGVAAVEGDVHPGERVVVAGADHLLDGARIVTDSTKGHGPR